MQKPQHTCERCWRKVYAVWHYGVLWICSGCVKIEDTRKRVY